MTLATPPAGHGRSIDRVLAALERHGIQPRRTGQDDYKVLCPVHADQSPSLHVTYKASEERTALWCFGCEASWRDIAAALDLQPSDLFDRPLERTDDFEAKRREARKPAAKKKPLPARITLVDDKPTIPQNAWKPTVTYVYAAESGDVVQEVVRLEAEVDGVRHKRFGQRFVNPATRRMVKTKPDGFVPVLYNLTETLAALAADRPIYVVEGEKDADNAAAAGLIATTNSQGAGQFPAAFASTLAGGDIRVVVDRDLAGYKRAIELLELLTDQDDPARVRLLLPAVPDDKADLTDHLDAGFGAEDLVEISTDDATALSATCDAQKLLDRITVAANEAEAQDAAGDAGAVHQWLAEAEQQLLLMNGTTRLDSALVLGAEGERAKAMLPELRRQGQRQLHRIQTLVGLAPVTTLAPVDDDQDYFDGSSEDDGVFIVRPDYRVINGATVKVTHTDKGERFTLLFDGWAQLLDDFTADEGENLFDDPNELKPDPTREAYRFRFCRRQRDAHGKPIKASNGRSWAIEERVIMFDREAVQKRTWIHAVPWNMLAGTSPKAIGETWDAMMQARPARDVSKSIYTKPGWRRADIGGPIYVHRTGAIGPNGAIENAPVRIDANGVYRHYALPDPTTDAAALREAWTEGTLSLCEELPARIIAPLISAVWLSPFDQTKLVTHIVGARGAAKTGTALLALQYLAPLLNNKVRRKAQLSGSGGGGSSAALTIASGQFGHMPVLIDDFAPDSQPEKQREKLEAFGRAYYDAAPKALGGRDRNGQSSFTTYKPLVLTPITTGELGPGGSADTRFLNLPISPGDIPDVAERYPRLETATKRQARGLLGASLIQYLAANWQQLRDEWAEDDGIYEQLHNEWTARLATRLDADAPLARYGEDAAFRHYGTRLMLRMLIDRGALTVAEAAEFEAWMVEGIAEAFALQDSQTGDPALQFIAYIQDALANRSAYIADIEGISPPDAIADGLGWNRTTFEPGWIPASRERIGVVAGDRVYLFPTTSLKVARAVAAGAGETLSETAHSIGSSFIAHGWMERDHQNKQQPRRTIGGVRHRVWDIPLDAILDNNGPEPSDGSTEEPDDTPPTLDLGDTPDTEATSTPPRLQDAPQRAAPTAPQRQEPPAAPTAPQREEPAATVQPAPQGQPLVVDGADGHRPPSPMPAAPAKGASFTAAVAVLDSTGLWLPDGTAVDVRAAIGDVQHLGSFALLAQRIGMGSWIDGWQLSTGTIYLTADAAAMLQIPVDQLPRNRQLHDKFLREHTSSNPLLHGAIAAGWTVGTDGDADPYIRGFTTIWAGDSYHVGVKLALLDALADDFTPILTDKPTGERITEPSAIARRLQRLADVGVPYKKNAATTGLTLLNATLNAKVRPEFMRPSPLIDPSSNNGTEADFSWTRKPRETELSKTYVHSYDRGGSYLAAMAGLNFGLGRPEHVTHDAQYVRGAQAYYLVAAVPEAPTWGTPHPLGRFAQQRIGKSMWISAPTLELAHELELDIDIEEAYVWRESRRYFDKYYQQLRDARTTLDTADVDDQAARDVVKAMYTRMVGLIGSSEYMSNQRGYAPERRHSIVAKARANLYRAVYAIGTSTDTWPLAMQTDSVLYASDDADPAAAWPGDPKKFGRALGSFKHEASALMNEHAEFFTGAEYRGKRALGLSEE